MISLEFVINSDIVISIGGFFYQIKIGTINSWLLAKHVLQNAFILRFYVFYTRFQLKHGLSWKSVVLGDSIPPSCTLIIFFSSYNIFWPRKTYFIPLPTTYSLLQTRLFQMICVFHGMRKGLGWPDLRKAKIVWRFLKFNYFGN